jgi:hypothetical protein
MGLLLLLVHDHLSILFFFCTVKQDSDYQIGKYEFYSGDSQYREKVLA